MKLIENIGPRDSTSGDLFRQFHDAMTFALPLASRNLMSVVAAAEMLASGWVPAQSDTPEEHKAENTMHFGSALLSSLNALLRECARGNIQAYSPATGLPLEIHYSKESDEGIVYDHTCLIKIDAFYAWITKNGLPHSGLGNEVREESTAENRAHPRSKVRAAWLIILHANITQIDAAYGGKATVLDAIKWLKAHGGDRIMNKGYAYELFWIDDNDSEQVVKRKTVSTALSVARKPV